MATAPCPPPGRRRAARRDERRRGRRSASAARPARGRSRRRSARSSPSRPSPSRGCCTRRRGPPDRTCERPVSPSEEPPQELRLVHAPPHRLGVAAVGLARRARMPGGGLRQRGRQQRRLVVADLRGRLAEIAPAGALHTPHARPEFYDVQVELEDPPLAERALELPGEDGFAQLAQRVARGREPEIPRELLADGGCAARQLALAE